MVRQVVGIHGLMQLTQKDAAKGSGSGRAGLHGPERQHALYRENGLP